LLRSCKAGGQAKGESFEIEHLPCKSEELCKEITPRPQASRDRGTEFEHPAPDRFIGQVEAAFGKQFLDIALAQGEAEIEPNCVLG
jgi:hypothetical protein